MSDVIEWLAVACGSANQAALAAGYQKALAAHRGWLGGYGGQEELIGYYVTSLDKPSKEKEQAIKVKAKDFVWVTSLFSSVSYPPQIFRGGIGYGGTTVASKFSADKYCDLFPGVVAVTTDGRAIVLTAYDFWKNKPRDAKLLGDFLLKLALDDRVAGLYSATKPMTISGGGPLRVYSEEDLWLLLDHPELKLAEVEGITSAVQNLNALKAELAALEKQKAELQAHMELLAQQAQFAAGEQAGAQQELVAAQQALNQVVQTEAEKLSELSLLEKSVQEASAKTTRRVVVGVIAVAAVAYFVIRGRQ